MKTLESMALRCDGSRLWILDQTLLPDQEVWLDGGTPEVMIQLIRRLAVRGAPLIGVAAALCLAQFAEDGADAAQLREAAAMLREARPTAVNLAWAMDRMSRILLGSGGPEALAREAEAIFDEDVALCEAMARHGLSLFGPGEAVLTHCNSGGLATAGIGTALGVIRRGCEQGLVRHVFVDETRPLLQGARLTAWELGRLGIPHTLVTDGMAALLLRDGLVQRVLVGADRIAANGDFANKVGTYGLAVQARYHGVPFHPVAPYSTVDPLCPDGAAIPIEMRNGGEVRGFRDCRWAPRDSPVFNPAFDVTPADLVTSLVLDRGIVGQELLRSRPFASL
ncbi:MAG TPA: S-methyl-5-thioribose-1-phosphate isomerase [Holophaga sp.]|nr:S-methyl-5-thioribose-1-phosphate isomerase [Holophaga sp.]HPS68122.1 S-methyl-5-thioribose-1-phosphate isomerase [Holophaga sp.]